MIGHISANQRGATSEAGKYLFRVANVWWRCAQYFVIASCGKMPRDNRCMYMMHACFYGCCNDCVEVCGNVCVRGVMNVVFSVCIVTHGAVGARVWEV